MIVSLIPSFLPRWGADKKAKEGVQDRTLSPTAYLDGLRLVNFDLCLLNVLRKMHMVTVP